MGKRTNKRVHLPGKKQAMARAGRPYLAPTKEETALERHMREAHNTIMPRPELFLITGETIAASDSGEVMNTYADMESLDIAHLPYSHCIIGVPGAAAFRLVTNRGETIHKTDDGQELIFPAGTPFKEVMDAMKGLGIYQTFEARFHFFDEKCYNITCRTSPTQLWKPIADFTSDHSTEANRIKEDSLITGAYLRELLIVLLATRNAIKTRVKDKLLSLGIGKRKAGSNMKPLYTTTITLPPPSPAEPGEPTGRTMPPHLRRGHIRQQAWGPRRSFHKAVWIEPVFVNADPDFVSTRVAYNTSL